MQNISDAGLEASCPAPGRLGRKEGSSSSQDPQPGDRIEPGNFVTIVVSTGKPKTRVPTSSAGAATRRSRSSSNANLQGERRRASTRSSPSTRCWRRPRRRATSSSRARRSASTSRRGRSRSRCPNVVGPAVRVRPSPRSRVLGFAVAREDVEIQTSRRHGRRPVPAAGTQQAQGLDVITLQVSEGPQTSQVPDVTSQDGGRRPRTARRSSGFRDRRSSRRRDDETRSTAS